MPNRAKDWLKQALKDLEHAKLSKENKDHEWACFAAHQAAEKALKALHLSLGQEAWGHVTSRLLIELPKEIVISEELIEKAKVLDNYYIPARYPDSHPDGAPFEHYGSLQSEEAVKYACEILKFVRTQMA